MNSNNRTTAAYYKHQVTNK